MVRRPSRCRPLPARCSAGRRLGRGLLPPPRADGTRRPFVIGVTGGTASGKKTVCDMIIQQLHDHRVVLVNQDSFYRGLTEEQSEHVQDYNFDHPDAFDTDQLLECMGKLKSGQSVNIPIYDFKNHRRCSESFRKVNASDVIILEGILVFHDQRVRDLMDMKFFVDTDANMSGSGRCHLWSRPGRPTPVDGEIGIECIGAEAHGGARRRWPPSSSLTFSGYRRPPPR